MEVKGSQERGLRRSGGERCGNEVGFQRSKANPNTGWPVELKFQINNDNFSTISISPILHGTHGTKYLGHTHTQKCSHCLSEIPI